MMRNAKDDVQVLVDNANNELEALFKKKEADILN